MAENCKEFLRLFFHKYVLSEEGGWQMMDYNSELSFGASESRYAEIRAQREYRRQARGQSAGKAPPARDFSQYDDVLDDDIFGERPKGSFAKIVLTQAIVCALLVGLAFLAQRAMPNTYRQLQQAYTRVMQTDMTVREVWAAASGAFQSLRGEIYVAAPQREENPEEETQNEDDYEDAYEDEEDYEYNYNNDASEAPEEPAAGGPDITPPAPTYTFMPLRTTVPPVWPVDGGELSSGFGYRYHPVTGAPGMHTGIDIAAPEGTPVAAAFRGTVYRIGYNTRAGNYIILDHGGGMQTVYMHCYEILVEEGMAVRAGETIALVGSTGDSTGPHLHFELRVNGVRGDPLPLL